MNKENEEHKREMQKQKEDMKERVSKASENKGVVILLTGDGKGKSSSGLGMVLRSLGHGMKVGVVQFIKGKWNTGEQKFFEKNPDIEYFQMGAGFTWDTQDKTADIERTEKCWAKVEEILKNPEIDLVLIDELNVVVDYNYLDVNRVIEPIKSRPPSMHVVITGRGANDELKELADTVSVVESPKHAFKSGIKAQRGVEF